MSGPTLVYLVRPGDDNPELRYSLRSLVNVDHGEVWVVGYRPSWLCNVGFIPGNTHDGKMRNVSDNTRLAARHPDMPDEFVMMNDDFFFLKPYKPRHEWRWTLAQHIGRLGPHQIHSEWGSSLKLTLEFLQERGFEDPLSYEVHSPMPVEKAKLAEVMAMIKGRVPYNPPQWRSVYGNYWEVGGPQIPDPKIYDRDIDGRRPWQEWEMVSTSDGGFAVVRGHLEKLFPRPCEYERRD